MFYDVAAYFVCETNVPQTHACTTPRNNKESQPHISWGDILLNVIEYVCPAVQKSEDVIASYVYALKQMPIAIVIITVWQRIKQARP